MRGPSCMCCKGYLWVINLALDASSSPFTAGQGLLAGQVMRHVEKIFRLFFRVGLTSVQIGVVFCLERTKRTNRLDRSRAMWKPASDVSQEVAPTDGAPPPLKKPAVESSSAPPGGNAQGSRRDIPGSSFGRARDNHPSVLSKTSRGAGSNPARGAAKHDRQRHSPLPRAPTLDWAPVASPRGKPEKAVSVSFRHPTRPRVSGSYGRDTDPHPYCL